MQPDAARGVHRAKTLASPDSCDRFEAVNCRFSVQMRLPRSHALIDGRSVSEYDGDSKAADEIDLLWNMLREGIGL